MKFKVRDINGNYIWLDTETGRTTPIELTQQSNQSVNQANQQVRQIVKVKQEQDKSNKQIADRHAHRAVQERNQKRITPNVDVTKGNANGTIQDADKVAIDKAFSWYGLSNGLGQTSNLSDSFRNTPEFGKYIGDQNINTLAVGLDPVNPSLYFDIAAQFGKGALRNWGLVHTLANQINSEVKVASDLGKQQVSPLQVRPLLRYGDVEINNPQLAYRQGTNIASDFLKTNKVTTPEGNYGRRLVTTESGRTFNFGKTFQNPMFAQGKLWYGVPESSGDLLVTAEPLALATKSSAKVNSPINGTLDVRYHLNNGNIGSRRVMNTPEQLNTNNTTAYTWKPGYGYKRITEDRPRSMTWGKAQTIIHDNYTGSPYDNNMGKVISTVSRGAYRPNGLQIKGKSFGKFIGGGDEQEVFENIIDPTKVLKVYKYPFSMKKMRYHNSDFLWERNTVPFFARQKFVGFVKNEVNQKFPVYTQERLTPLRGGAYFQQHIMPRIQKSLNLKGFSGDGINSYFTNGKITIGDLKPENIGIDSKGRIRFLDMNVYHNLE